MAEGQEARSDAAGSSPAPVPDVTVVVAVYNTMPYLVECLDSLVTQSLLLARPGSVEVIAVDDGSTDGSGETLDRYAATHPDVVRVIHQENSGGPARPNNVALDAARGRWVYFVGADDYLAPEALERMTAYGDRTDADIVIGAQVGVDRHVPRALFGRDHTGIDPFGPHLRWTLANSKLFRRSHIESLGLRYREDMRIGSDQPFTLRASLAAREIAVLGSYDCYYAVRREDASNLTYSVDFTRRAADTERLIESVIELVPPEHQAHFLVRHFTWELNRLLPDHLPESAEEQRAEMLDAVRRIIDRWSTPELQRALGVVARVRLCLAVAGEVEALALLRDSLENAEDSTVLLEEDRALAALPVLRTPAAQRAGLSDDDFRIGPRGLARRMRRGMRLRAQQLEDRRIVVEVDLPLDPASPATPGVWVGPASGDANGEPIAGSLVRQGSSYRIEVVVPADGPTLAELGALGWQLFIGGTVVAGEARVGWRAAVSPLGRQLRSKAGAADDGGWRDMLGRLKRRVAGQRDGG